MSTNRYRATGVEVEFEPGSRRRVLRNLLGITRVRDMNLAESQALEIAQDMALDQFDADHRFTAKDICDLHTLWLGPIYPWAGEYRSVDIGKGGFQFAHARLIQGLMAELERGALKKYTPCRNGAGLSALGGRVRKNYRALEAARCCQYAVKLSWVAGALAVAVAANGARMPSTADDVLAEIRSAALRAATVRLRRNGLDSLRVMGRWYYA